MADAERQTAAAGEPDPPAAFFEAVRTRLLETRALGRTLDLACGRGRHALAAARDGLDVLAVDRNAESLATLRRTAAQPVASGTIETRCLDLEGETPPDLGPERFGAILVFRYLHRPRTDWLARQLAPGGLLAYETFTTDQRALGWGPKQDAFLLTPQELPTLFPTLETLEFEEGPSQDPKSPRTARLLARRRR